MSAALTAAVVAASGFWGSPPPCGQPTVTFNVLRRQIDGHAYPNRCRIKISTRLRRRLNRLCLVVAHEYGHLMGHGHTRRGLMSPTGRSTTPQCKRLQGRRRRVPA